MTTVNSTQSATVTTTDTTTRTTGNKLGKDAFFQILSAQLQYQDPMSGGDNTEYIAQMAQFSALEQMENLNNSISEMMKRQDLILGSQWIGKQVAILESDDSITTGEVSGFMVVEGEVLLHVNGNDYTIEQITAVKEQEEVVESESAEEGTEAESEAVEEADSVDQENI